MKILHIIERFQKAPWTSAFCGELLNQFAKDGVDCRFLVKKRAEDFFFVDKRIQVAFGDVKGVLAEALKQFAALSDEVRRTMGMRGRQLVEEKYTWSAVTQAMLVHYNTLR